MCVILTCKNTWTLEKIKSLYQKFTSEIKAVTKMYQYVLIRYCGEFMPEIPQKFVMTPGPIWFHKLFLEGVSAGTPIPGLENLLGYSAKKASIFHKIVEICYSLMNFTPLLDRLIWYNRRYEFETLPFNFCKDSNYLKSLHYKLRISFLKNIDVSIVFI